MVAKTLAYEAKNYGRTFLAAATATTASSGSPSRRSATSSLDGLGAGWSVEHADVDDAAGFRWRAPRSSTASTSGVAFAQYFGHSSYNVWSFSILFASPHAMQLQNAGRPAVVAQWGCWNTYYVHPPSTPSAMP